MAGTFESKTNRDRDPDILFDLTPEDDKALLESDLLSLVNFGQLDKSFKIPGHDGRNYDVAMALLWDEDWLDLLKMTTQYSNDTVLRVKIMRKLKLHRAIQSINNIDYSDTNNKRRQRQLWVLLSRMSEIQIGYLDSKYTEMEIDRNLSTGDAIKALIDVLNDTASDSDKKPVADEQNEAPATPQETQALHNEVSQSDQPVEPATDHDVVFKAASQDQQGQKLVVEEFLKNQGVHEPKVGSQKVVSPKQKVSK